MTIVEKAAYLKGLTEGLGIESDSKEGKLWGVLTELLSDMAHEVEDLQESNMDCIDALDEVTQELSYLEEIVCDLDTPEDFEDYDADEDDDYDEDVEDDYDFGDIVYDVTCPNCGKQITVEEDVLESGSVTCPGCGELLEFDLKLDLDED